MINTSNPQKWMVLALTCAGTFMSTLDASIVNVALPTLTKAFKSTVATSQWYVLIYTFVVTVLLLFFGKISDLVGRRRIYVYGVGVFVVGSLLCGVSVSSNMMILSRALQGIGSAVMMSVGPAIVTEAFGAHERGKSLGFIGSAVAFGLMAGPVFGGMIVRFISWQWIFFINIPIGITLIILMLTKINGFNEIREGKPDIPGSVLMMLSLGSFIFAITHGASNGWFSFLVIALFVMSAILITLFINVEKKSDTPLLSPKLFENKAFTTGIIAGWTNYASMMPVSVFMPFYLQRVLHLTPDIIGYMLACGVLTLAIVSPFAGSLSDKIGCRLLTSIGMLICVIGMLLLRTLNSQSSIFDVIWRLVVTTFGSALFVSPNNSSIFGTVSKKDLGVASGVVALVRNFGMVCGIAISGAIITSVSNRDFSLNGLKAAFLFTAILSLAGAFISLSRVANPPKNN